MSVEDAVIDDDILNTMTDEERSALQDPDYSAEEIEAMKEIADDSGGDTPDESVVDSKPVEDVKQEDPQETSAEREFSVALKGSLPEGFEETQNRIAGELAGLTAKFRDGEIDVDAFVVENDRLTQERAALYAQQVKAEVMNEITEQTSQQKWQWHVDRYLDKAQREDGVDYRAGEQGADFDRFVRILAEKPENGDKDFDWFLSEAHKRVKVLHGIETKAAAPEQKPASRKPETATMPKTLASVPGGDSAADVAGEYASLDKLEGLELEDALHKMSPAQRERWLRA